MRSQVERKEWKLSSQKPDICKAWEYVHLDIPSAAEPPTVCNYVSDPKSQGAEDPPS